MSVVDLKRDLIVLTAEFSTVSSLVGFQGVFN